MLDNINSLHKQYGMKGFLQLLLYTKYNMSLVKLLKLFERKVFYRHVSIMKVRR